MNILMFSGDTNALREGSAEEARLKEYARVSKHFVVVVLTKWRERYVPRRVGDSLWLVPVAAPTRFLAPFYALHAARRELFFQGALQCDVIDGRDASSAGFAAWIAARRYKKPFHLFISENVLSSQYASESLGNWFRRLRARFMLPSADALTVDSEVVRAEIADISDSLVDRTTLIPPFLDVTAIQNAPLRVDLTAKYPAFKFILLAVADLTAASNVKLAILTLAGVLRVYPHAGLVVVGKGKGRRELEAFAARVGVGARVAFEAPTDNLYSYYKTAHVLLNTALYEAPGMNLAEAAAAGCVIVSTMLPQAQSMIHDGVNGFLCDTTDPACFVRAVSEMIKTPSVRDRVRINGMQSVEERMNANDREARLVPSARAWEAAIRNFAAINGIDPSE